MIISSWTQSWTHAGPKRGAETLGLRREQGFNGYREVVEEIITAAIGGNARVFGHIPNLTLLDVIPPGCLPAVTAKGLL
jgi:hypothetical protein